jgi:hypothetical protein
MNTRATAVSVLIVAALACGCASSYEAPPSNSPSTARVRVVQQARGVQLLAMHLPGACLPNLSANTGYNHIATLEGSQLTTAPHRRASLGMPDPRRPAGSYSEFVVRSGAPFHFGAYFEASLTPGPLESKLRSCLVAVSFEPQQGKDYEIVFRPEPDTCVLSVNRLEVSNGQTTREPVTAVQPITRRCG